MYDSLLTKNRSAGKMLDAVLLCFLLKCCKLQRIFDHLAGAEDCFYTLDTCSSHIPLSLLAIAGSAGLQGKVFTYIDNSAICNILCDFGKSTFQNCQNIGLGNGGHGAGVPGKICQSGFAVAYDIGVILSGIISPLWILFWNCIEFIK